MLRLPKIASVRGTNRANFLDWFLFSHTTAAYSWVACPGWIYLVNLTYFPISRATRFILTFYVVKYTNRLRTQLNLLSSVCLFIWDFISVLFTCAFRRRFEFPTLAPCHNNPSFDPDELVGPTDLTPSRLVHSSCHIYSPVPGIKFIFSHLLITPVPFKNAAYCIILQLILSVFPWCFVCSTVVMR